MIAAWKRSLRLPSVLRRWIATLRNVLFRWVLPRRKRVEGRMARVQRHRFRPGLELLEDREVPGSILDAAATAAVIAALTQAQEDLAANAAPTYHDGLASQANQDDLTTAAEVENEWLAMLSALSNEENANVQLVRKKRGRD
jgi:hypothetical protein